MIEEDGLDQALQEVDEVIAGGPRALLAEGEVVVGRAALVAMALDGDLRRAVVLHPERVLLEDAARRVGEPRLVVVEMDVGQGPAFESGQQPSAQQPFSRKLCGIIMRG